MSEVPDGATGERDPERRDPERRELGGSNPGGPDPRSDRLAAFEDRLRRSVLTRWLAPLEAEPSYGLMARLSARHGFRSFRLFNADLMIDDGAAMVRGCTKAVAAMGLGTPEQHAAIARFTPTFGDGITIAGEPLPRRAFLIGTRRFCPACLHESPHHRVWFDLRFVRTCPLHGLALTDRTPEGATVHWSFSDLVLGPNGVRLDSRGAMVSPRDDLETHVLRRFGLMPPEARPTLEGVPLHEIVRSAIVLGRLSIGGFRTEMPRTGDPGFDYDRVQAVGWSIFSQGRDAIVETLSRVAAEAPANPFGRKNLFGWLSRLAIAMRDQIAILAEVADQLTVDLGLDRRGTIAKVPSVPVPYLTPIEIAQTLGLSDDTVRTIAARVGVFQPRRREVSGLQTLVRREDVDLVTAYAHGGEIRTKEQIRDTISRSQVASLLGIPVSMVYQLVQAGRLKKFVYSFSNGKEDRFSHQLIEEFLDAIPVTDPYSKPMRGTRMVSSHIPTVADLLSHTRADAADFFAAVDAGDLRIDCRVASGAGLRDFRMLVARQPSFHPFAIRALSLRYTRVMAHPPGTISQKEAGAILEVKPHTVQALTSSGLLKTVPGVTRDRLDEASVRAFAARYAAGKLYLGPLGAPRECAVPSRLKAIGVRPLGHDGALAAWKGKPINVLVDRREMREALGLRRDPDVADVSRVAWKSFADRLGGAGSPFYCARVRDDGSACFVSQGEYLPINVRYVIDETTTFDWAPGRQVYRIEARLELGGLEGRKRLEATGAELAGRDCRSIGVDLRIDQAAGTCSASIDATIVCMRSHAEDLAELMDRYLEEDANLIHRMLLLIRLSLEVGRPFRKDLYGLWPAAFSRDAF